MGIELIGGVASQRVVISQTKMNDGSLPSVMLDRFGGQFLLVGADSAYGKFHMNGSATASASECDNQLHSYKT